MPQATVLKREWITCPFSESKVDLDSKYCKHCGRGLSLTRRRVAGERKASHVDLDTAPAHCSSNVRQKDT